MLPGAAAYSYLGHVGLAVATDQIGIIRTALIAVGVVTLTICLPIFINKLRAATNQPPALTVVSARDLMRRLDTQENLAVLDVRNADEYTGPLMTWKVGPALACGNTVIVKPSEESPGTATLLATVMNEVGVPPGVDAITFTGETRTGAAIMQAAAQGVRDVSFELGGKNAGIVFADADLEAAIQEIGRAVFLNCGQVCLGTERVYVERPLYTRFVAALRAHAAQLKPGDPKTIRLRASVRSSATNTAIKS